MNQYLFGGQPHHAYYQSGTGQQVETFGDHADDSRHHGLHAFPDGISAEQVLLDKQDGADGDDQKAHHLYQAVERPDHFRLFTFPGGLGFQGQTGNIGVRAYLVQSCAALAGDNKAS